MPNTDGDIQTIRVILPRPEIVTISSTAVLGSSGGSASTTASLVLHSSGDSNNRAAHPYLYTNAGVIVKDANNVEVFRIWATDPDPSNTNFGIWNLFIGFQSGFSQPSDNTSSGFYNTGIGYKSLYANTTGFSNVAIGLNSLGANTTGGANVAIGATSMQGSITGGENTAVGYGALQAAEGITGNNANCVLGYNALSDLTDGFGNVAIGKNTGSNSVADNSMTFVGYLSDRTPGGQFTNGFAIGANAIVGASNTGVIGDVNVTDVYFGTTAGASVVHPKASQYTPLTIATLPTPVAGMVAYITDGDAGLAWGATAVNSGSGATKYLVWYNGVHWTVTGK